jgi:hypothetical protein
MQDIEIYIHYAVTEVSPWVWATKATGGEAKRIAFGSNDAPA